MPKLPSAGTAVPGRKSMVSKVKVPTIATIKAMMAGMGMLLGGITRYIGMQRGFRRKIVYDRPGWRRIRRSGTAFTFIATFAIAAWRRAAFSPVSPLAVYPTMKSAPK
jgi:hypothetical protein